MPLGIDECRGVTSRSKRRGQIGVPGGAPTDTDARRLGEPWKMRVQDLTDRKEGTQSTM